MPAPKEKITIKRYASRRLYNTQVSDYVTLDEVATLIRDGHDVEIIDLKTGEDLTRQYLLQIITDQEARGENILPLNVLTDIVRSYSEQASSMVPDFLASSFDMLKTQQAGFMDALNNQLPENFDPINAMEKWQQQQGELLSTMMQSWWPGADGGDVPPPPPASKPAGDQTGNASKDAKEPDDKDAEIKALKAEMAALQEKLSKL